MMKKFLSGVMAAAVIVGTVAAVTPNTAQAAKVSPKPKYSFDMNKANKKVVAVARKGDGSNMQPSKKGLETGVMPTKTNVKLKYAKGKHGKALYLDRSKSYGAELKGLKLGSKSWTVAFWVKASNTPSSFMPIFFTGNKITDPKNCKWISVTKTGEGWTNGFACPAIWSHSVTNGAAENTPGNQFPWYAFQNEDGVWQGDKDNPAAMAVQINKWVHITLVVDTADTCEYGEKGKDGYVKSYHAWTYINGKLWGNGTVGKGTMSNANKFFLGINAWDVPFKGYFDDVMLWNKALTGKQVAKVFKAIK